MKSTAAAWGPLSHQLENVRVLSGLRRIVLAWQDPQGEWKHVLRCSDDMVPQAEARLLDDLFRVHLSASQNRSVWQDVLHRWHAEKGWYENFTSQDGAGFFATFCEAEPVRPEHTAEWLSLALPALAQAANELDRNRSLYMQRQAVLESALSLAHAESEPALLMHAARLTRRLFSADAAACLLLEGDPRQGRRRVLAEDPEAKDGRFERWDLDESAHEALAAGGRPMILQGDATKGRPRSEGASLLLVPFQRVDAHRIVLAARRDSGRPYSSYDQSTLAVFCRQVEGVLENRQLLGKLKAANLELTATQAQLVESARLQTLGEVAASVAHDFNNVLGALLGRVQLLQHASSDAGVQGALGKMERVIAEGENTVKRLQEAAHSRKVDLKLTLDGLVRDVFSTTESVLWNQTQIHDRKVVWLTEFMPTATVIEQAAKVRAALRQLLTDVSTSAPVNSVIELRTRREGGRDRLTFVVASDPSDSGGAFRWQELSGYSAFATAMEQVGGELSFDSSEGVRTLDVCMVPRQARLASESGRRDRLRVLVVDDDQDVRDVLSELLVTDGHAVYTAEDGADALKQFSAGNFDIVFTDLGMPGISGWQVAEQLKRESPGLPVVMVTGWGYQLDPDQVERSGVDRVLTKPFQWLKVLDTLHELVPRDNSEST